MANLMSWKTTVIDVKISKEFVKDADEVIELSNLEDILSMDLNSYDASVILSHSPKTDDIYLKALLNSNMNYIGMMGNKKNMQRIKQEFDLLNEKRFFAPIGLDIGGNTHQAIALSICSQIEAHGRKMGKFKMKNSKDLAVVILAAGTSSRLGNITKQLLVYKNETLLKIAVKKALEISKDVFVVLGHEKEKCEKELESFDVNIIYNTKL
jgi:hypothetical protein